MKKYSEGGDQKKKKVISASSCGLLFFFFWLLSEIGLQHTYTQIIIFSPFSSCSFEVCVEVDFFEYLYSLTDNNCGSR